MSTANAPAVAHHSRGWLGVRHLHLVQHWRDKGFRFLYYANRNRLLRTWRQVRLSLQCAPPKCALVSNGGNDHVETAIGFTQRHANTVWSVTAREEIAKNLSPSEAV